jgi:hypothetical protein
MLSDPSQRGHLHSEHRHQLRPLGLDRAHTEGARQARMSGQVPPEPDGQALPEEIRQRQRQTRARTLTSPRAVAKRAAAARKKAARSRSGR